MEAHDRIRSLIGHEKETVGGTEREIARQFPTSRHLLHRRELTRRAIDREYGDAVVAAIGRVEEFSR